MVDTIKFSEFIDGGDLSNNEVTVGLGGGGNSRYNNPWTFLKPGTTGDRPIPSATIYYRLRLNTTLEVYEYYDPTTLTWTQLSGTGTGTVNPGVTNDLAFYAVNGQIISPVNGANSSVLVTSVGGVPSLSTTLPSGLSIPGATITASTAALLSGSVVAAPVAGIDITNKTYVDALVGGTVLSITGTTNQITASSPTGNVTLSLPQDIALGSTPTFLGLTLSAIPLGATSGGTGQSSYTLGDTLYSSASNVLSKLAGNITTAKLYLSQTGTGAVSAAPSWAAIAGSDITGAALTKVDDTNVTLTLGGTPATSLLRATSLTLGWAGLLAITRGGTGVGSVTIAPTASAFAGWDTNSNLSANNFLASFATTVTAAATTVLTVASAYRQEFTGATTQTVTLPVTSTLSAGHSFYVINNSSGNVTINSSGGNLFLTMAANTAAFVTCVLPSGTTAASWNASYVFDAGAGVISITGTANQVIASASTGNITLSLPQSIATTSTPTFGGLTLTAALTVPNGGTGLQTTTAYAVLCGGTTSTAALQSISSVGTSGQVLTSNGAGALPTFQAAAGAGGLISVNTYSASTTWTRPSGCTFVYIECLGGGGGGGAATTDNTIGTGGASGGFGTLILDVTAIGTATITIGAAGSAGSGAAGGDGGTSSFAANITCTGGQGGFVNGSTSIGAPGGSTGGDTNVGGSYAGSAGASATAVFGKSGYGADFTPYGTGGRRGVAGSGGGGASGFGAGGGGGYRDSTTSRNGGAGTAGFIRVWNYR